MQITSNFKGSDGIDFIVEYNDADTFDHLEKDRCKQCYGVCFTRNPESEGDKFVI